ncbi:DUF6777 domain-containing protein [Streptomyces antimicrobicus]|uniref:DUF6777 domain-containing protein n=1 Tax=Streptomyces antimicrobicus TaxID=2883108 RepID=A0ABS8B3X5_9ACTN|nr:DUF6777 domain-containing protein [Streptomyces antimicrobicus]MCB5179268.1 hypothetical protein [Streptomyces antimicrobicus]
MTTQPSGTPPPERPTGPPRGPLSGRQEPPAPPPPPPAGPGGPTGGAGGAGGSGRPWWRSLPVIAVAVVALAAVATLTVVLSRPSGPPRTGGELFLQPAAAQGRDPFTESTATQPAGPSESATAGPTPPPAPTGTGPVTTRSVTGSDPTLYGGTRDVASCDVEKQIRFLSADPAKNQAFATALGIGPTAVPGYLRSLTPVTLRHDTRVTNHGYRDGRPTAYQALLQAGTAVLVDNHGVPRVRCACGNPLGGPAPLRPDSRRYGQPWAAYRPQNVVVIRPTITVINKIVIYDHGNGRWYERGTGPREVPDRPVEPPVPPASRPPTPPPPKPPSTEPGTPTGTDTDPGREPRTDPGTGKPTQEPPAPPDTTTTDPGTTPAEPDTTTTDPDTPTGPSTATGTGETTGPPIAVDPRVPRGAVTTSSDPARTGATSPGPSSYAPRPQE